MRTIVDALLYIDRLDGLPVTGITGPLPAGFDGPTLLYALRDNGL